MQAEPPRAGQQPARPIRVAQIIGDGRPGGGTSFVLNLAAALRPLGFDSIIVGQRDSYLLQQAALAGHPTVALDFTSRRQSLATGLVELRRRLEEVAPDLLHVHGTRAGLSAVLSRSFRRWPMIYTVHGLHFHHKSGLRHRLGRLAEILCLRSARETVFVSEGDRGYAEREGILGQARRQQVLHNAIPPLGDDLLAIAAAPKQHDIVFLGRLEPQKNPLILADILAALSPSPGRLAIVGSGSLEGELRRRIDALGVGERVTWCGALPHAEALRTVARARVLLLPSLWEGHPLSVIEAMQLGLPVVASDIPGTNEIVADGETGFLVPATDPAAYADRLRRLLADPALCARQGAAGQARIATQYSFAQHVARHVELYRSCLQPEGPTP
jgi:glycosyltransferase involved in cell wall biosynthesis